MLKPTPTQCWPCRPSARRPVLRVPCSAADYCPGRHYRTILHRVHARLSSGLGGNAHVAANVRPHLSCWLVQAAPGSCWRCLRPSTKRSVLAGGCLRGVLCRNIRPADLHVGQPPHQARQLRHRHAHLWAGRHEVGFRRARRGIGSASLETMTWSGCATAMPPCVLHPSHLRGGVALAQRGGAVLQRLVVNGDGKGNANLVRACIPEKQGRWASGQRGESGQQHGERGQ